MATSDQSRNGDTGTFLSHTHIDDAGGRFAAVNAAKVVGQSPAIAASYPACSPALAVQLPDEPPLGLDNPELESSMAIPTSSTIEDTGNPAHAPSGGSGPASPSGGLMSERAGLPSSSPNDGSANTREFNRISQPGSAVEPSSHQDEDQ